MRPAHKLGFGFNFVLGIALGLLGVGVMLWGRYSPVSSKPAASNAPAPSASVGGIGPRLLQRLSPARRAELAAFDLEHARALRERDQAIDYCEKHGWAAAMGFGTSVICVHAAHPEFVIEYPKYPTLDP